MAIDILQLLRDQVTSVVLQGQTSNVAQKETALNQFYPILLSLFQGKPDLIQTLLGQVNPRFGDLFNHLPLVKQQFLEKISGTAPTSEIENTLSSAILPTLNLLKSQAGSSDPNVIAGFIGQFKDSIGAALPSWTTTVLSTLGIGGLGAAAFSTKAETLNVSGSSYNNEPPEKKKSKLWPLLALIAGLILLALLFKTCSSKKEVAVTDPSASSQPVDASQVADVSPASLKFNTGENGELLDCDIKLGDASFVEKLKTEVKKIFGSTTECTADSSAAFSATFPDQDKVLSVISQLKGIPSLGLDWVGDKVSVKAANVADTEKAVGILRGLLPNLNVETAGLLDINSTVDKSLNAAEKALSGLTSSEVKADDIVKALNLQIINFATGKADIPEANKKILNQAAELLKSAQSVKLSVEGHTDSTGDAAANKQLSQERAQSVVNYLVAQGAPASQLTAVGYGQEKPKAENDTEEGRFANRRIEFTVVE